MSIDSNTIKWLKENNYQNIIDLIEKKDLHQKLQNTIDDKSQMQRSKI